MPDLRTADLSTFLAVRRCGTLAGAARELKVTPSQVSKSVARLGRQLQVKLLTRTARGMVLSDSARRLLPQLQEIADRLRRLQTPKPDAELTVVAPSYLASFALPVLTACQPGMRLRVLELAPSLIRHHAVDNLFELALTCGREPLPSPWVCTEVGSIRKVLLATPKRARALGPQPIAPARLRDVPLISPIFISDGQFIAVSDDCPLGDADRKLGHQAQTIGHALELAALTDQVVFGPVLAARSYLKAGRLVEVAVAGWNVEDGLFLACNSEQTRASTQRAIVTSIRAALRRLS